MVSYELKVKVEDLIWIDAVLDGYHETIRKAKMLVIKNTRKEMSDVHRNLK